MTEPRIAAGGLRELGMVNWLLARAIARSAGVESAQLFTTLGRHRRVFRGWLHFSATLLFPSGSRSLTRPTIIGASARESASTTPSSRGSRRAPRRPPGARPIARS